VACGIIFCESALRPDFGSGNPKGEYGIIALPTLVTFSLTIVPVSVTVGCSLVRGTSIGGGRLVERVRFLRAGLVTPFSGGLGIGFPWVSSG
jgi:hypothetical protein